MGKKSFIYVVGKSGPSHCAHSVTLVGRHEKDGPLFTIDNFKKKLISKSILILDLILPYVFIFPVFLFNIYKHLRNIDI